MRFIEATRGSMSLAHMPDQTESVRNLDLPRKNKELFEKGITKEPYKDASENETTKQQEGFTYFFEMLPPTHIFQSYQ